MESSNPSSTSYQNCLVGEGPGHGTLEERANGLAYVYGLGRQRASVGAMLATPETEGAKVLSCREVELSYIGSGGSRILS